MFLPDRFLDHKGNIQIPDAFIPFSIGKKEIPIKDSKHQPLFRFY